MLEPKIHSDAKGIISRQSMKHQIQLNTYVDRLTGGPVRDLVELLNDPLAGVLSRMHLLPFFSSNSWETSSDERRRSFLGSRLLLKEDLPKVRVEAVVPRSMNLA